MFEVGFTEIVLIFGLALLVLGPQKLPGLVRKVGLWTGRARAMARQLQTQLEHEVTLDDFSRSNPIKPPSQAHTASPDYSGVSEPAGASDEAAIEPAAASGHDTHAEAVHDDPIHADHPDSGRHDAPHDGVGHDVEEPANHAPANDAITPR